jgi:hypothetical protein
MHYHHNLALDYAIRKCQENHVALKLNGKHQLISYDDDVNLQGDGVDIINTNVETLIDSSKESGLCIRMQVKIGT